MRQPELNHLSAIVHYMFNKLAFGIEMFIVSTSPSTSSGSGVFSHNFSSSSGVVHNTHPVLLQASLSPGKHSVCSVDTDYPDGSQYRECSMHEALGSVMLV